MASFISSNDRLHDVLNRIYNANSGVVFKNKTDEFKILIRNVDEGSRGHFMTFDVAIIVEEGDDVLLKCLENMINAVGFDSPEESEFVLDQFEFDKRERSEEEEEEFRTYLNRLQGTIVCPCGARFIHDGKDMCLFCDLTSTPEKLAEFECPICLDKGHEFHAKTMSCCKAKMHIMCSDKWEKKGNSKCAMCRADLPKSEGRNAFMQEMVTSIAGEIERRFRGEGSQHDSDETVSEEEVYGEVTTDEEEETVDE
jgi:hypothetical protein